MQEYTKEQILKIVQDEDVEFVRLQFTDMYGSLKNIAVTARELVNALDYKRSIDGSFMAGIAKEHDPDMLLYPILSTFQILPWRPQEAKVARLICDIYKQDGTPLETSSRYILDQVNKKAEDLGYSCVSRPEFEFFLYHTDEHGMPTTVTHEKAGYLDISPLDFGENVRRDMVMNLEKLGIEVRSSHHEIAPAQHEIDIRRAPLSETADRIQTVKMTVRSIAKLHGLHATFMPKPRKDVDGSGMHLHFSLFKDGRNIFVDPDDPNKLTDEAYFFIGGLLNHSREMALITNPIVNSYKRLVPGYVAPTELTWTRGNQNSLVRIPRMNGEKTSIELRSPDGASNPYLVMAVCLAAGLDGLDQRIYPTKASERSFSESDARAMAIEYLPESLNEALDLFEKSDWIKEVLGKDFCAIYAAAKKKEWTEYLRSVSDWELKTYLNRF